MVLVVFELQLTWRLISFLALRSSLDIHGFLFLSGDQKDCLLFIGDYLLQVLHLHILLWFADLCCILFDVDV